jgi:hypothetical protein
LFSLASLFVSYSVYERIQTFLILCSQCLVKVRVALL